MSSVASRVYFGKLRFCGCGEPEKILRLLLDILGHVAARSDARTQVKSLEAAKPFQDVIDTDDVRNLALLYMLDAAEIVSHGYSIYGCWLTPLGDEFLAALQGLPEDAWLRDDAGWNWTCLVQQTAQDTLLPMLQETHRLLLDGCDRVSAARATVASRIALYVADIARPDGEPQASADDEREPEDLVEDLAIACGLLRRAGIEHAVPDAARDMVASLFG